MIRATLCALALFILAAIPLACDGDGGGGGGEDILSPADTTPDVPAPLDTAAPLDTLEDTQPPPEDTLEDTVPPPDAVEDLVPPPDTLEDIPWEDIPWEDIPYDLWDIPDGYPDVSCEGPLYSTDCAEIPYFQCGFMGFCGDGVLTAEWHEHIFCEGQENIVGYWCEHPCTCKDGEIMDWPEDGAAFVEGYCDAPTDCIPEGGSGAVYPGELPCCEGLTATGCGGPPDPQTGECMPCAGAFKCTACGDGVCKSPENACTCPADCATPSCDIPPLYAGLVLEDILANPVPLDGDPVAFEGVVIMGDAMCTTAWCPPEDPCCNSCGANYKVTSDGGAVELVGGGIPQVGCYGDNCTFMDNCTPFPEVPGGYVLWPTGCGSIELCVSIEYSATCSRAPVRRHPPRYRGHHGRESMRGQAGAW
ncbi:MAG: hypothetical protein ABIK09_05580, partial [Pseudomonadota bacterium]